MADEWTFVSRRKATKHRRNPRKNGTGSSLHSTDRPHHPKAGRGSGLYGASFDPSRSKQRRAVGENIGDGVLFCQTRADDRRRHRDEKERILNDILECLHALENQLESSNDGFAFRLMSSLAMAASSARMHQHDDSRENSMKGGINDETDQTNAASTLRIREIVAYGIGNFASDQSFQAPAVQLACLLLIRRCCAREAIGHHSEKNGHVAKSSSDGNDIFGLFEYEQGKVPIFYYEPCILPVEKELLEKTFHVHVLQSNEMGKRTVESMLQEHHHRRKPFIPAPLPSSTITTTQHSLFYMPHCPMRLYCNVLWAHWSHIFPLTATSSADFTPNGGTCDESKSKNPIVIFGNSFYAYEERAISSEERSDATNGILQISPFIKEMPTGGSGIKRRSGGGSGIVVDALRHLEVAFNDCNVISFPVLASCNNDNYDERQDGHHLDVLVKEEKISWPSRPKEWIASPENEDYEELK